MQLITAGVLVGLLAVSGCGGSEAPGRSDDPPSVDDRIRFVAESDGVRAVVADCFVVESEDGTRRYQTTVEVSNGSDSPAEVKVTIEADLGRGGTSAAIEVAPGSNDAWSVTGDDVTNDPAGDVDCDSYIRGIAVTRE